MNHLEKKGKNRTIFISTSILLISLHTIYFYYSVVPEVEAKTVIKQLIRFILTIGLLIMIYKGKSWARIIGLILFIHGVIGAFFGLFNGIQSIVLKSPFIVMIFIYSIAIYHFWFSKSFKAFFNYQNAYKSKLNSND